MKQMLICSEFGLLEHPMSSIEVPNKGGTQMQQTKYRNRVLMDHYLCLLSFVMNEAGEEA